LQAAYAELEPRSKFAIIDDDETARYILSEKIGRWGHEPAPLGGKFSDVDELVDEVLGLNPAFVLCDNRLQPTGYANFFGADAVVRLNSKGYPSVLVTSHQDDDLKLLRRWRPQLPVVLDKDDLDEGHVGVAYDKSYAEVVLGNVLPERRPHRTHILIDCVEGGDVIAFVPAWNSDKSVRFELKLMGDLGAGIKAGSMMIAEVNIGAASSREIFLQKFEAAPDPNPEDGLG
jgi:hypothetical protein